MDETKALPATDPRGADSTRVTKVIAAPPESIYAAFMDSAELVEWLPPGDMTATVHAFDGQVGGGYDMSLYYAADDAANRGKTAAREDRVNVRFVELDPPRKIVEAVTFVSDDPWLQGEMTMTATVEAVAGGSAVTLLFENLPPGLSAADNEEGSRQSLEKLAGWMKRRES
jgi:uncharacterized protein YndB with AHSA1/START domain